MTNSNNFDAIIIGGSYSGLSAAMALGRSLRKVLVIDSGLPCNRQTPHSHNFLTQDGTPPKEISALAKHQVEKYDTIEFHNGLAVKGTKTGNRFKIEVQSAELFNAKKLIFASGIRDIMPGIKGFSECWGISILHCPYCHGYEVKNEVTGILANGDAAMHYARLVHNLTKKLTIYTNGKPAFTDEQIRDLERHNVQIVEAEIDRIAHSNGRIEKLIFNNGKSASIKALYAKVPFVQHSDIPESLGCEMTEEGFIQVNAMQETTVQGVFACGDATTPMRSVANAVATGNFAGAVVNKVLCEEQFEGEVNEALRA